MIKEKNEGALDNSTTHKKDVFDEDEENFITKREANTGEMPESKQPNSKYHNF